MQFVDSCKENSMSISLILKRMVVALPLAAVMTMAANAEDKQANFASLPAKVSSFGAAVEGSAVYVFGGHVGEAHAHSKENLSNSFLRLDLNRPSAWEELAPVAGLQGVPLVACQGKLYRIGGLDAKNTPDEDADLFSAADVQVFDPKTGQWSAAAALPEGRSSHDAIALDGKIYCVGGWLLTGKEEGENWLEHSLVLDVTKDGAKWEKMPEQGFQRRALATAAARGRIYAIGGMTPDHKMSSAVDYFDVKEQTWKKGPDLPFKGFGASAVGVGDELYTCGLDGKVYRLSDDGAAWEEVATLKTARFFHRLLPLNDGKLLVIAGASMQKGHLDDIEVIDVRPAKVAANAAR
jgi:N-acetylneuraminic acid mutarotase